MVLVYILCDVMQTFLGLGVITIFSTSRHDHDFIFSVNVFVTLSPTRVFVFCFFFLIGSVLVACPRTVLPDLLRSKLYVQHTVVLA